MLETDALNEADNEVLAILQQSPIKSLPVVTDVTDMDFLDDDKELANLMKVPEDDIPFISDEREIIFKQ